MEDFNFYISVATEARQSFTCTKNAEAVSKAIYNLEKALELICINTLQHESLCIDIANLLLMKWAQFPSDRQAEDIMKAKGLLHQVTSKVHPDRERKTNGVARSVVAVEEALECNESPVSDGDFLSLLVQSHEEYREQEREFLNSEAFIRSCIAYLRATSNQHRIVTALKMAYSNSLSDWVAATEIPFCQSALGELLRVKYTTFGDSQDINRACEILSQASSALPDDPDVSLNFACTLGCKYQTSGDTGDLDEGTRRLNEVYDNVDDLTLKASASNNLALLRDYRCHDQGSPANLEADLMSAYEAVHAAVNEDPTHPLIHQHLNSLSTWLLRQYQDRKEVNPMVLDYAIEISQSLITKTEPTSPRVPSMYTNLCTLFRIKYHSTGSSGALHRSIEAGENSLEKSTPGTAIRLQAISTVTETVGYDDDALDIENCIKIWREALNTASFSPMYRVGLAVEALHILKSNREATRALEIAKMAIGLLAKASPESVQGRDRLHILEMCAGLASDAAALAFECNTTENGALEAITLLEEGRGILADYQYQGRQSLSHLRALHPTEASRYDSLIRNLNHAQPDPHLYNGQERQLRAADNQFHILVNQIRSFDEFEMFLQPPTTEQVYEIAKNTGQILVVINVSFRCDAFAIHDGRVTVVPSLNISEDVIRQWATDWNSAGNEECYNVLHDVWRLLARPILDNLELKPHPGAPCSTWPRICWIPTGILIGLPIHAAGDRNQMNHQGVIDGVLPGVLDYAVSSYSVSIKALIHTHQNSQRKTDTRKTTHSVNYALLVSMPTTPGHGSLPFAETEVALIHKILYPESDVPLETPKTRLALLGRLSQSEIFHFAGHGRVDRRDLSKSALILEDGDLTVADLQSESLHITAPRLAYLSACSTGVSASSDLVDEAIHLMGACQVAGFQSVIGTLWRVDDKLSMRMAVAVYKDIPDRRIPVALALHNAIHLSRQSRLPSHEDHLSRDAEGISPSWDDALPPGHPRMWAAYIYMGI